MTQPDHLFPQLSEEGVSPKRAHSVSYWKTLEHFSLAIHRGLWIGNTKGKAMEKENFSGNSCPLSSRPSFPTLVTLHATPNATVQTVLLVQPGDRFLGGC